jgi:hypothetical protein
MIIAAILAPWPDIISGAFLSRNDPQRRVSKFDSCGRRLFPTDNDYAITFGEFLDSEPFYCSFFVAHFILFYTEKTGSRPKPKDKPFWSFSDHSCGRHFLTAALFSKNALSDFCGFGLEIGFFSMVILFGVVQNFYTISHNNRFLLIQRMLSK